MSEQGSNGAAAPAQPALPASPPSLLRGNKLTDFFMEGQEPQETGQKPPAGFTERPKSITESEAEAGEPINEQQASVQAEVDETAGELGSMLDALPEGKGGREQPFSLTDLPEDRYIEIKVDGEKEIVSLRELASGHVRRKAFNKFANRANAAADEALKYAQAAMEDRQNARRRWNEFLTNPKILLEFMLEHQPDVAEQFARGYAEIWDVWQRQPDARRRFEWERQQRQLANEREKLQRERETHDREMNETRAAQAEIARLKPIVQRAMRELGFPKVTPKFKATVDILCERARRANGGKLDSEDLYEAIHQAHKMNPAPGTVQERKPAPAVTTPRLPAQGGPQRKPNGQYTKDWSQVPYNRRMSDPDFFLRK